MVIKKPFVENLEGQLGVDEDLLAWNSWINFLKWNLDELVMNLYG